MDNFLFWEFTAWGNKVGLHCWLISDYLYVGAQGGCLAVVARRGS